MVVRAAKSAPLRAFALLFGGWVLARFLWEGALVPVPAATQGNDAQVTAERPANAPGKGAMALPGPVKGGERASDWASEIAATGAFQPGVRGQIAVSPSPDRMGLNVGKVSVRPLVAQSLVQPVPDTPSVSSGTPQARQFQQPTVGSPPITQKTDDSTRIYAYVFVREGQRIRPLAPSAGRFGGSQAGISVSHRLTGNANHYLAATGRFATALDPFADERLSMGLQAKPFAKLPVQIAVERRFGLSQQTGDDVIAYLFGGVGPLPVVEKVEAEFYGQAGVAIDDDATAFADAQLTAARPLWRKGNASLSLGGGLWGGGQGDDWRLDAGPRLEARLPLAGGNARLSLDWRQRVVGDVQPGSGVAVTLSSEF